MKIPRDLATSLTIGAFGIMSVTGILMFFHADSGLNKVVHEWASWAMVTGVVLHVVVNWVAFKRYFTASPMARGTVLARIDPGPLPKS
jgi:xanthine/uracil permease